jgi:hypothetical protein
MKTHYLQGCQIFLGTTHQNGEIYTKCTLIIPNGCKIDQMCIKLPTSLIARPSKNDPKWGFWFENIPSGNLDYLVDR